MHRKGALAIVACISSFLPSFFPSFFPSLPLPSSLLQLGLTSNNCSAHGVFAALRALCSRTHMEPSGIFLMCSSSCSITDPDQEQSQVIPRQSSSAISLSPHCAFAHATKSSTSFCFCEMFQVADASQCCKRFATDIFV